VKRVVVLVSGTGTLLQALLDAQADGTLGARIVGVVSDRADAGGLQRAHYAGLPTVVVPLDKDVSSAPQPPGAARAAWDAALTDAVASFAPDLVVGAGFMRLLGPSFLARFDGRVIGSHPALLPSFPGAHGVRDALAYGVKVTGATIFQIDAGVDTGRILAQEAVDVLPGDTEDSLHERIKVAERSMLVRIVRDWSPTERKP